MSPDWWIRREILVPMVLRGNAVPDAPRRLTSAKYGRGSVQDRIPTEDRGNERLDVEPGTTTNSGT